MSGRISIENVENGKLKRRMEEHSEPRPEKEPKVMSSTSESNAEDILNLRLGIHTESSVKSLEFGQHSSSSQSVVVEPLFQNVDGEPSHDQEVAKFSCPYCDNKYSTRQALGGHQNAHKRERAFIKMEKQRREEELISTFRFRSIHQSYPYPTSSPNHYQEYSYLGSSANLHHPISHYMDNTMPSWASGSSYGGYGGLFMPTIPTTTPQLVIQMPNSSLTTTLCGSGTTNQTPLIAEACTGPIGEGLIQTNPNVSSSSTQSTLEELNLDFTL